MKKSLRVAAAATVIVALLVACEGQSGRRREEKVARQQLAGFIQSQPVPVFSYSQLRQNLIEIETAQAKGIATTSFFFHLGSPDPIKVCPSIGYPIPATYQLTNPEQKVQHKDLTLPQIEATGVYTADTTGTYIVCVDPAGKARANYWEGYVETEAGPATWDASKKQIVPTGDPSAEFSTGKRP